MRLFFNSPTTLGERGFCLVITSRFFILDATEVQTGAGGNSSKMLINFEFIVERSVSEVASTTRRLRFPYELICFVRVPSSMANCVCAPAIGVQRRVSHVCCELPSLSVMALPQSLRVSVTPPELELISCQQLVEIVPLISMEKTAFISVNISPQTGHLFLIH